MDSKSTSYNEMVLFGLLKLKLKVWLRLEYIHVPLMLDYKEDSDNFDLNIFTVIK